MKYLNLTLNLSLLIGILFIFQDERNNRLKLEDLSNRIDNVNSEFDIYKHKINSLSHIKSNTNKNRALEIMQNENTDMRSEILALLSVTVRYFLNMDEEQNNMIKLLNNINEYNEASQEEKYDMQKNIEDTVAKIREQNIQLAKNRKGLQDIINQLKDNSFDKKNKVLMALNLFYIDKPSDLQLAINEMFNFYTMEFLYTSKGKKSRRAKPQKIYDWDHDQGYVYSAFLTQYGIDLQEVEYMHWWKFRFLFMSLNEDNKIVQMMSYRGINLSDIKDKNERKRYEKLKREYEIPLPIEERKQLDEIEEALMNGRIIP